MYDAKKKKVNSHIQELIQQKQDNYAYMAKMENELTAKLRELETQEKKVIISINELNELNNRIEYEVKQQKINEEVDQELIKKTAAAATDNMKVVKYHQQVTQLFDDIITT